MIRKRKIFYTLLIFSFSVTFFHNTFAENHAYGYLYNYSGHQLYIEISKSGSPTTCNYTGNPNTQPEGLYFDWDSHMTDGMGKHESCSYNIYLDSSDGKKIASFTQKAHNYVNGLYKAKTQICCSISNVSDSGFILTLNNSTESSSCSTGDTPLSKTCIYSIEQN